MSAGAGEPWSARAEAYRESEAHREGPDLDLLVEWSAGARTALDVGSGGGHVARRLRDAGLAVTTCDPAPGMTPDVVCAAEHIPFADGSFDVVATRLAAHHFADARVAVGELARVSADRVLVADNLFAGDAAEEAERLRDPSHVRTYTEAGWRGLFEDAGIRVLDLRVLERTIELESWLARAGCEGEEADRVCALLADRLDGGRLRLERICVRGGR
ncbi:MAG: class I SAM-dependent methyltransferase [Thermoleophilia bacterium]|nr:class I SAM-dependent methyltransferase [Thermoleophilia bacterium]